MTSLPLDLLVALLALFAAVAVVTGMVAWTVMARATPERRRLEELVGAAGGQALATGPSTLVADAVDPTLARWSRVVPKSPKEMGRLRRRLAMAGRHGTGWVVGYALCEMLLPIAFALVPVWYLGLRQGALLAAIAAMAGYMIPGFWLMRQIEKRKKQIRNGLPDALDLLVVCVEAGSSLDQAIVKASEELAISYPALAEELRLLTTEIRAGKPRLEAFRNFADRTKVDDVRALTAMLVQTDRFGTSIAQALRTHAETSRTKRRQNAEERAAKLGVKLVFPLVFCLFPALYVVTLGPAVIQFVRVFFGQVVGGS